MRIDEALRQLRTDLKNKNIENPALEADLLLMHFLGVAREVLMISHDKEIPPPQWAEVQGGLRRRLDGEPMAYILGYREFYKHRFLVGPGVLIPRPDTETIIDAALELAKPPGPSVEIADLGSGSGCIGLSLIGEFSNSRLWTCDVSATALKYCSDNAKALGLSDRVEHSLGDVQANKFENRYDIVVSNPPYIAVDDARVAEDVKKYEPSLALFAGQNGLEFYNKWLPWALQALKPGGWAFFEVGEGQHEAVQKIAMECGFAKVELRNDLSGIKRVVCARKSEKEKLNG